MTISIVTGDEFPETEIPLLEDGVIRGSVDFKGRPSVRSKSGCWRSASFIIGTRRSEFLFISVFDLLNFYIILFLLATGVAERFAYYGVSANLVSYLTENLGQPTATGAAHLNAWFGTASLLPIAGAFVAESFSGRFWMTILASLLYISVSRLI